jgi:hypothetical protein
LLVSTSRSATIRTSCAAVAFERLGDYVAGEIDRHNVLQRLTRLTLPMALVWEREDRAVPLAIGKRRRAA